MRRTSSIVLIGCVLFALASCGAASGYCQSGPKYGTQCYSENDRHAPGERPRPPSEDKLNPR